MLILPEVGQCDSVPLFGFAYSNKNDFLSPVGVVSCLQWGGVIFSHSEQDQVFT